MTYTFETPHKMNVMQVGRLLYNHYNGEKGPFGSTIKYTGERYGVCEVWSGQEGHHTQRHLWSILSRDNSRVPYHPHAFMTSQRFTLQTVRAGDVETERAIERVKKALSGK
jgi:hypothetical protein